MKKIVLFLLVLLMAVPVMASNVTITCSQGTGADSNQVTVRYASDVNYIRAFGLDINTGSANITQLEPNALANYRIYPGQISIVDGNVTSYGTAYPAGDLGDDMVTVEMGSLYTMDANYAGDPNAGYNKRPAKSGILLKFRVSGTTCYKVDVNAARGGIVMENPDESPNVSTPLASGCLVEPVALDCGDAPDTYPTLLASGGPSHTATGPTLGVNRDTEADGLPSALCNLDDTTGVPDDEDGVTLINAKNPTGSATVNVSAVCLLSAWMDFNGDGDFADAGEQILTNTALVAGNNALTFPVPAVAKQSRIVSRWRVSTVGGLSYTGAAADGEVEDYITECLAPTDPGYAAWTSATWNRPRCWCFRRQCRGDVDGAKAGFWVSLNDLNILKLAFNKTDAQLLLVTNGICADLDHLKAGFRVSLNDLNILKVYFNKSDALTPACDAAPIITGPYNFWTNTPN